VGSGTAGHELNLDGRPDDFDRMAEQELMEFIEAQGEIVRELERRLLSPLAPKQRTTKH
jgi:hypothetical protein